MACDRETVLLISCYADGEATPEESVNAESHLANCADCRKLVEQWRDQQRMFEWAYDIRIPEETATDWQKLAGKERRMSVTQRTPKLPWIRENRNWLRGAAVAAVLVIALLVYYFATLPPMLKTGAQMASGSQSQPARMEGGIRLVLGPGSSVERIDDTSIRLKEGWITASVRHGTGFRIRTRRMEVLDKGTVFQVGSGQKLDYVVVERGSVQVIKGTYRHSVDAGHVLLFPDKGSAVAASLPEPDQSNIPVVQPKPVFNPTSGEQLDWNEGVDRLSNRFPNVRQGTGSSGGTRSQDDLEYRLTVGDVTGLKTGLREHFAQIAQAAATGRTDSGEWEIPVGLIQTSPILTSPGLPADVYYVRLVSKGGTLFWRLTGSKGSEADFPFDFGALTERMNFGGGASGGSLQYNEYEDQHKRIIARIRLTEWPGDLKPLLKLTIGGSPISQVRKDDVQMLGQIARATGVPESSLAAGQVSSGLVYLDPGRKHRLLILWHSDATKELNRLQDLAKQGRSGSATIGALASDLPFAEPSTGAGVHLFRCVLPSGGQPPYLEITTPDGKSLGAMRKSRPGEQDGGQCGWSGTEPLPGHERLSWAYSVRPEEGGAFPVHIMVTRPDLPPDPSKAYRPNNLVEGWLNIKSGGSP